MHHHMFDRESASKHPALPLKVQLNVSITIASQFAYSSDRHLTPSPATIQQFLDFKERIGASHSVLTHGLSYGSDCSSLLAFLQQLNRSNVKTRGIGVIDPNVTPEASIADMHAAGVRGIRVNLYKYNAMHDVERQKLALHDHARRLARFPGWTMAFTPVHPEFWEELTPVIRHDVVARGIRPGDGSFCASQGCFYAAIFLWRGRHLAAWL